MAGARQARAGDQDRMAQRQEVDAGVDGQRRVQHRKPGGLHEPVEPEAGDETDVVSAADVVDAFLCGLREERAGRLGALLEQTGGREDANPGAVRLRGV
jgi:hypothetical protein